MLLECVTVRSVKFSFLVHILSLFFFVHSSLVGTILQITEQIYVGSCIQTEDDVENLSDAVSTSS